MAANKQYTTLQLVGHSVAPTATEGMVCAFFGVCIVAAQLLLQSINVGTSWPAFFDGQWAVAYTNSVVRPAEALFNNPTFNDILTLTLWGLVGLSVYFLIEYSMHAYKNWHEAQTNVQFTGQTVIRHPVRRSFVTTVIWRLSVLTLAFVLFVALQPAMHHLLVGDSRLVLGDLSLATSLRKLAVAAVGWTLVAHCTVVLLRLFAMRTRLFGQALY